VSERISRWIDAWGNYEDFHISMMINGRSERAFLYGFKDDGKGILMFLVTVYGVATRIELMREATCFCLPLSRRGKLT